MRTLFRLIADIFSRMLGIDEEAEKADMHLSTRALGLALSSFLATFVLVARYISTKEWFYLVLGAGFLIIFIGILLCYKNQRIYIISDEEFIYSTMFGKKKTYRFEQIIALRKNRDSLTLFVGGDKVHIESSAVLSDRLKKLIIQEFQKKENEEANEKGDEL
jgi:hypothetical protein